MILSRACLFQVSEGYRTTLEVVNLEKSVLLRNFSPSFASLISRLARAS